MLLYYSTNQYMIEKYGYAIQTTCYCGAQYRGSTAVLECNGHSSIGLNNNYNWHIKLITII